MSNWLDHSSIVGHLGKIGQKISDPLAWVLGDKYTHLTSDVLPEKVNSGLSTVMKPFDKIDETINPVRKIPIVDRVGDIVKNKPGDAAALVAGAYFAAPALGGGGAGGGAGSAGATGGEAVFNPAVDSQLASSQLGLTATGAAPSFAGSGADVAGLAEADSNAVAAEGAEPGLTSSYSASPAKGLTKPGKMPGGQQKQKRAVQWVPGIDAPSDADYTAIVRNDENVIAQSSRAVKTPAPLDVARKGLQSGHPIDVNGGHMLAIQKLNAEIEALTKRVAAAKAARGKKGA